MAVAVAAQDGRATVTARACGVTTGRGCTMWRSRGREAEAAGIADYASWNKVLAGEALGLGAGHRNAVETAAADSAASEIGGADPQRSAADAHVAEVVALAHGGAGAQNDILLDVGRHSDGPHASHLPWLRDHDPAYPRYRLSLRAYGSLAAVSNHQSQLYTVRDPGTHLGLRLSMVADQGSHTGLCTG
jgi:hypothetical protein